MAKLTARGAFKVIGYVFDHTDADADAASRGERVETHYVLRSDGAVLRKVDFIYPADRYDGGRTRRVSGSYSIYKPRGTVSPANRETFRAMFKREPTRVQRY